MLMTRQWEEKKNKIQDTKLEAHSEGKKNIR